MIWVVLYRYLKKNQSVIYADIADDNGGVSDKIVPEIIY